MESYSSADTSPLGTWLPLKSSRLVHSPAQWIMCRLRSTLPH